MNPTSDLVKQFWSHMSKRFGAFPIKKCISPLMRGIGTVFDTAGVVASDKFAHDYATTIGTRIYVPFEIGEDGPWSLWSQMVVCAHECQHIIQSRKLGWGTFSLAYLASKTVRTKLEGEAYATSIELNGWRFGSWQPVPSIARRLAAYNLDEEHVTMAEELLSAHEALVRKQGWATEAGKEAISFLNNNASWLREV